MGRRAPARRESPATTLGRSRPSATSTVARISVASVTRSAAWRVRYAAMASRTCRLAPARSVTSRSQRARRTLISPSSRRWPDERAVVRASSRAERASSTSPAARSTSAWSSRARSRATVVSMASACRIRESAPRQVPVVEGEAGEVVAGLELEVDEALGGGDLRGGPQRRRGPGGLPERRAGLAEVDVQGRPLGGLERVLGLTDPFQRAGRGPESPTRTEDQPLLDVGQGHAAGVTELGRALPRLHAAARAPRERPRSSSSPHAWVMRTRVRSRGPRRRGRASSSTPGALQGVGGGGVVTHLVGGPRRVEQLPRQLQRILRDGCS